MSAAHLLSFWFEELRPAQWWQADAALDALLAERFGALHAQACAGELADWRLTPQGRLAEILLLDQFSRQIWRGQARAFAQDGMALVLAQEAVAAGVLPELSEAQRPFLLMPYMHSESAAVHAQAAPLFAAWTGAGTQDFERRHREIVERFGRYPHRNQQLGRSSSAAELDFLRQPGSGF